MITRILRCIVSPTITRETRLPGDLGTRIRDVQVGPYGLVYTLGDRSRPVWLESR